LRSRFLQKTETTEELGYHLHALGFYLGVFIKEIALMEDHFVSPPQRGVPRTPLKPVADLTKSKLSPLPVEDNQQ
jgi:hypothetical protein